MSASADPPSRRMSEGEGPSADAIALVCEDRLSHLYWSAVSALTSEEYAAGMAEDEYLRRASRVAKLELFMNTLSDPEYLADFPNLVELAIHLESMPRALGIAGMRSLQRLCITECGLRNMAGIENCTALTHLDLSQNAITEMDDAVLKSLMRLRTLWLCENQLTTVTGLEGLPQLSCLWLGKNRITSLCDALDGNAALEELNVAGNSIANFKDIPNLSRMRRLTSLSFGEPHFGENPLCSLCNYSTYVLFHMPQLKTFDSQVRGSPHGRPGPRRIRPAQAPAQVSAPAPPPRHARAPAPPRARAHPALSPPPRSSPTTCASSPRRPT